MARKKKTIEIVDKSMEKRYKLVLKKLSEYDLIDKVIYNLKKEKMVKNKTIDIDNIKDVVSLLSLLDFILSEKMKGLFKANDSIDDEFEVSEIELNDLRAFLEFARLMERNDIYSREELLDIDRNEKISKKIDDAIMHIDLDGVNIEKLDPDEMRILLEALENETEENYNNIMDGIGNDPYFSSEESVTLPMIPLRGITMLPHVFQNFEVGRKSSLEALNVASEGDQKIFLVTQIDPEIEDPEFADIRQMGVICDIQHVFQVNDDIVRVMVEGYQRAYLEDMISIDGVNHATVRPIVYDESKISPKFKPVYESLARKMIARFKEYQNLSSEISADPVADVYESDSYSMLADVIATNLSLKPDARQEVLDEVGLYKRMALVFDMLLDEIDVVKIDRKINMRVRKNMNKAQKDFYLREQIKAIQKELGEGDEGSETDEYTKQLESLNIPEETREKIEKEIEKLNRTPMGSPDYNVMRNYLDTIFALPWNKESRNRFDIKRSEKILDEDHYGLEDVKERILEYLAVKKVSKNLNSPIICLAGPPGVGKTSIAKSVARSLGRQFVRISLGGVRDEAEIRGHRRTYVGAIPGRIINAIKEAKAKNPVILLDEIDKMSSDFKGDPTAAMLEVLDPEQNKFFVDHYLELPFDLSKVMFITTANDLRQIPRPLYDRMEVIEIEGYLQEEKLEIVKRYILTKQLKQNGLKKNFITIDDEVIKYIISGYTRESGVRQLERTVGKICRKVVKEMVENPKLKPVNLSKEDVKKYLGTEKYRIEPLDLNPQVGLVNGLAWTSVGGVTLEVEVSVLPGKGNIVLTGMMGDVMKESARTGISYIRAITDKLDISQDFYKEKDIHIHIPEGATPKDGPSAGITMTLATISALTDRPVPGNIAMTGEITLRGRVLAVGGVREKVLAAYRMGIRKIIIPKECEADLEKIPENVKKDIEFFLVEKMEEVLGIALMKKDEV